METNIAGKLLAKTIDHTVYLHLILQVNKVRFDKKTRTRITNTR